MSKTRTKQGIEEKWGDCSNVSTAIVKQGIKGSLGYCANRPMTIGKSDFEGGMATYAQKWKTAEIYKRKSAGRLHVEIKHQDCGSPPPQVECWSVVLINQYYQQIIRCQEQLLIFYVNKIEKNATTIRRIRDHKHIGLLMKENLGCQLS